MFKTVRDILMRKEFSIFDVIEDYAITIGLVLLIPLSMIQGIKVFIPEPTMPPHESVWKLEGELRKLEYAGKKKEAKQVKEQLREERKELEEKQAEYNKKMEKYVRYYLLLALIVGIALLFAGAMIVPEFLSLGLMMGGLSSVFYALFYGWSRYGDMLRFLIVLTMIIIVIALELFLFRRPNRRLWRFVSGSI